LPADQRVVVECAPAEQRYFGTSVLRYFGTDFSGEDFPSDGAPGYPREERAINEKPIKVDAETDRLVSELAYFLGSTKKAVVREAVADFAAARGRARSADSDRRHVADDTSVTGDARDARDARAVLPLHQRFDQLPLIERLSLRRSELIRAFADHGASNIRVLGPLAFGRHADEFELLAETDPIRGGEAAAELQMIAARLLCAPSTVVSSTALRLFNPDRLRRALEESRPL
jgi:hypothetical protein